MHAKDSNLTVPAARPRRSVIASVKMSSMVVTGELAIAEDLYLTGEVIGRIEMRDHMLTVTSTGRVDGDVFAKSVVVLGEVQGTIVASLRVTLGDGARVVGDLISPRVSVAAGAHFHGAVDMQLGDEYWERRRKAYQQSRAALLAAAMPAGAARANRS